MIQAIALHSVELIHCHLYWLHSSAMPAQPATRQTSRLPDWPTLAWGQQIKSFLCEPTARARPGQSLSAAPSSWIIRPRNIVVGLGMGGSQARQRRQAGQTAYDWHVYCNLYLYLYMPTETTTGDRSVHFVLDIE